MASEGSPEIRAELAAIGVDYEELPLERTGTDPRSDARLPFAGSYHLEVIVTCQEGYTSSLAAAALQDLGLYRATDLAGGFAAWRDAGLPVTRG